MEGQFFLLDGLYLSPAERGHERDKHRRRGQHGQQRGQRPGSMAAWRRARRGGCRRLWPRPPPTRCSSSRWRRRATSSRPRSSRACAAPSALQFYCDCEGTEGRAQPCVHSHAATFAAAASRPVIYYHAPSRPAALGRSPLPSRATLPALRASCSVL